MAVCRDMLAVALQRLDSMRSELDHLVIAAATLEQGVDYVREALGVEMAPGGRHPAMGTHNALMRIGESHYLEVIAVDPQATPPERPRWFGLDDAAVQARLAERPRLVTWVVRHPDIESAARDAQPDLGDVETLSRGDLRWRLTVPRDGLPPEKGLVPALIEWPDGAGPAAGVADRGCRLQRLELRHPEPERLKAILDGLGAGHLATVVRTEAGEDTGVRATIARPDGGAFTFS